MFVLSFYRHVHGLSCVTLVMFCAFTWFLLQCFLYAFCLSSCLLHVILSCWLHVLCISHNVLCLSYVSLMMCLSFAIALSVLCSYYDLCMECVTFIMLCLCNQSLSTYRMHILCISSCYVYVICTTHYNVCMFFSSLLFLYIICITLSSSSTS